MKQINIMQISNGWVVSFPKMVLMPTKTGEEQLSQQPVSVHCSDAWTVGDTVRRLCEKAEVTTTASVIEGL